MLFLFLKFCIDIVYSIDFYFHSLFFHENLFYYIKLKINFIVYYIMNIKQKIYKDYTIFYLLIDKKLKLH
jgi:hypothetical protein